MLFRRLLHLFLEKDKPAIILMCGVILAFAHQYLDPTRAGLPDGIDIGDDVSYLGTLRHELLSSGRLMTWGSVAYDGIPLMGHPNTQFFYAPLIIPSLAFGTIGGTRVAYVFSLVVAGIGMYTLVRMLGPRPLIAAWAGTLFAMGGGLSAQIHSGHLQKVLGMPLIPLVFAFALLVGRAESYRIAALWASIAGLLHGAIFLAGDAYIPLFLIFAVPMILIVVTLSQHPMEWGRRLTLALVSWASGLLLATSGKLIASASVITETTRGVEPYHGSQGIHWLIVHMAFPFFADVPGLRSFSYGPEQITWGYGWWEFSQYIGFIPVMFAVLSVGLIISARKWNLGILSVGFSYREAIALLLVVVIAAFWLANGKLYSPVHWLFDLVTPLQGFRVPSRFLMLAAPVFLVFSALFIEHLLRVQWKRLPLSTVLIFLVVCGAGGTWWVNSSWWTPVQWSYSIVLRSDHFSLPVWIAVLSAGAGVVLVAFSYSLSRMSLSTIRHVLTGSLLILAVFAIVDVFHATGSIPTITEAPSAKNLRAVVHELKSRDTGPMLVGLGATTEAYPCCHGYSGPQGMYTNKLVKFEFVNEGIAIAENISPLIPIQQSQHKIIDLEQRLRYRVAPSHPKPLVESWWSPLGQAGDVRFFVNNRATGDAWLEQDGEIVPLPILDWAPGKFEISVTAWENSWLIIPANAFDGWHVSIDGQKSVPASEFDGYVATTTEPGRHIYQFVYKAPMLPTVLILGALPWVLGGFLLISAVIWYRRTHCS